MLLFRRRGHCSLRWCIHCVFWGNFFWPFANRGAKVCFWFSSYYMIGNRIYLRFLHSKLHMHRQDMLSGFALNPYSQNLTCVVSICIIMFPRWSSERIPGTEVRHKENHVLIFALKCYLLYGKLKTAVR